MIEEAETYSLGLKMWSSPFIRGKSRNVCSKAAAMDRSGEVGCLDDTPLVVLGIVGVASIIFVTDADSDCCSSCHHCCWKPSQTLAEP
jgi:hypothetical protein